MSYPHTTTTEEEQRDQPHAGHGTPVDGDILDDDPHGPDAREAGFDVSRSTDGPDDEMHDMDLGDDVAPADPSLPADGLADGFHHGEPAARMAEGEGDRTDREPVAEASEGEDAAGERAVEDGEPVATDAAYVGGPADMEPATTGEASAATEEVAPVTEAERASEGDTFTEDEAQVLVADQEDTDVAVATDQPAEDAVVVDEPVAVGAATTGGMLPGEASIDSAPLSVEGGEGLRDRWQQAQLGFIDDPYAAAAQARGIAEAAIEAHIEALRARQAELDAWQSEMNPDTEVLRAAMQGYREMVTTLVEE